MEGCLQLRKQVKIRKQFPGNGNGGSNANQQRRRAPNREQPAIYLFSDKYVNCFGI